MNKSKEQTYEKALYQAANKIEELHRKILSLQQTHPIAIIGMSCRFPGGANTPEEFWDILKSGRNVVSEIPSERWNSNKYYHSDKEIPGKMYTKYAHFIKDYNKFDPLFFNITPKEAFSIDPTQRLLLETSWEALEDSVINPEKLRGSNTGIYIAITTSDYQKNIISQGLENYSPYSGTGILTPTACGRLSYFYDFHGPSITVDTACSSSLVAVDMAVQSLNEHRCDMALVGGVQLYLNPDTFIMLSKLNAISSDGRCKTFDASADGYGRGEGCGFIVLKRLSDAEKNRDRILGIIKSIGIAHDGFSNGLTSPNGIAQENLIKKVIQKANITINDIDYIEAHGTGTELGDPIEVNTLGRVFKKRKKEIFIGTVKSNIGHLETCSGMASIIKVLLSLKNNKIPPSVNFKNPNPHIQWDSIPINVVTKLTDWNETNKKRIAGISAFGIAGTIAHMIIEEYKRGKKVVGEDYQNSFILTFSAKKEIALLKLAEKYINYLKKSSASIEDICYTSNISRSIFKERLAITGKTKEDLINKLSSYLELKNNKQKQRISNLKNNKKIVFMYTGQGSHYLQMGIELYQRFEIFKEELMKCDKLFFNEIKESIIKILYQNNNETLINKPLFTQPIIFSIEYALSKLWKSLNIIPAAVLGHSIGEYSAACFAGVISLEDAVKMVAARAMLMDEINNNGMMVGILTSENRIKEFIKGYEDKVSIAAINGPENITLSGNKEAIEEILQKVKKERIFIERLGISNAFHSILMEPFIEEFHKKISNISFNSPEIPIIYHKRDYEITEINYWSRHIRERVEFYKNIKTIQDKDYKIFIEIGGTAVLCGLVAECIDHKDLVVLPSLRRNVNSIQLLLDSISQLYMHGINIEWEKLYDLSRLEKVALPFYPFEKKQYWIENKSNNMDHKTFINSEYEEIQPQQYLQNSNLHKFLNNQLKIINNFKQKQAETLNVILQNNNKNIKNN